MTAFKNMHVVLCASNYIHTSPQLRHYFLKRNLRQKKVTAML